MRAERSRKLRVVFFCGNRSAYGLAHLRPLLDSKLELSAVVIPTDQRWMRFSKALSGPDAREGIILRTLRGLKARFIRSGPMALVWKEHRGLRKMLKARRIPCWLAGDVNDAGFLRRIAALEPDIILSAAYPQMFSGRLIRLPRLGAVNFHPSFLPKYRGAYPHFWAIAKGEKRSGVSAHFMTRELDAGDIVAQSGFSIARKVYGEVYARMIRETPHLVREVERFFRNPRARALPQDRRMMSFYKNPRESDRRIMWDRQSSAEIEALIRTQQAFSTIYGRRIVLLDAEAALSERVRQRPLRAGAVVEIRDKGIVIKTKDGGILVRVMKGRLGPSGAGRWARSNRVRIGDRFV